MTILDDQGRISAPDRLDHSPHHVYGTSRILYDERANCSWVFVPIPKCASTYVKAVFKAPWFHYHLGQIWNFEHGREETLSMDFSAVLTAPRRYVVVLRDIVDRWSSALAQIIPPEDLVVRDCYRWVSNPMIWPNNHLEPQISFLHGIPLADTVWFWADQDLELNLTRWATHNNLYDQLRLPLAYRDSHNLYNVSDLKAPVYADFVQGLRQCVRQDVGRERKVTAAYAADQELIRSVDFFRG